MASGVTALAYETVTGAAGKLPLLAPMSGVAGCMAPQVAAHFLQRPQGGRGICSVASGRALAEVVVLGGGVVGSNAADVAIAWAPMSPSPHAARRPSAACHSVLASVSVL